MHTQHEMNQLSLFGHDISSRVETEGIKYAGSKLRILPQILKLAGLTGAKTVLDGFSGTTRVSQAFAQSGYTVHANDVSAWSEVFGICYLENMRAREHYQPLIDHLNNVEPVDGWFTETYGGGSELLSSSESTSAKMPWQRHNTRKLDGIRQEIESLKLSRVEKALALTSLMLALDRVDNTLGHYAAYLREWSPRSFYPLTLTVPSVLPNDKAHRATRSDIFSVIPYSTAELTYFDPPYGSNNEKMPPSRVRYAAYYHIWTSVCCYDKPEVFGKVGRRLDSSDKVSNNPFEEFRKADSGRYVAVEAIERLLESTPSRWILLPYSSGGRATAEELHEALGRNGVVREVMSINHQKNVMAHMTWTREWLKEADAEHREYLFLLER